MAPVDGTPKTLTPDFAFKLVSEGKANDLVDVKKYRSSRTGLTVVIADVDGPVVNGYFCLATEAHDDDGLPHTLEHLIFLGSEKYPYKGVLDLLANRCLASGTNAWTDTDHTCYTMTTVGAEGFLSLMPIYLDHILYPTLTDQGFITEVHNITGEGRDTGIVYCEMQGRENSGESLCHLSMLRSLYPNCGYSSETGGIMKNLRESTDNIKVKNYHKEFYRPENLTMIISGKVKAEQVFSALADMENKICSKGERGAFSRPWQTPVVPLAKSVEQLVPYPCDEEDCGMIILAWRGPSAVQDLYNIAACSIILKYLTDTAVSPLQRDLVEIKDPFASQVSYSLVENSVSALFVMLENVPMDKLDSVKGKVDEVFNLIITEKEAIDLPRLQSVINRQILETLSHLESNPHDTIAFMAIGDFLYGSNQQDFQQRLNNVQDLRKLAEEPNSYWIDVLKEYFGSNVPCVLIKGKPSIGLQVKMSEEEEERVKQQCAKLGENGLKKKGDELMVAIEHNENPPPEEMLTSVPIPSTGGINFHTIESFSSASSEVTHPNFSNINAAGVMTHLINIKTNFVYMFALLDTSKVSCNLRRLLPLLLETILESPLIRDGVIVPYETVVSELEADTISASARIGLEESSRFSCGPFGQTAVLLLQLEPGKYTRCVKWMQEILFNTQLTTERLSVVATKMINDVAQAKRNGNGIAIDVLKSLMYCKESNQHCSSMIRQQRVLTEVSTALEAGGDNAKTYLDQLNQLRSEITKSDNLALMIAANFESLDNADQPWNDFLPTKLEPSNNPLHVTADCELLAKCAGNRGCIVGLGCVESSYLKHCCPCLTGYQHQDRPALMVFAQYLTQLEGPLWKQVRGQGLAYGYNLFAQPNEGLLYFTLFKSTNCVAAFNEARSVIEGQLKSNAVWEETLLDSAKSSLVFEIVEREKSVGSAVVHCLLSFFKGTPLDYSKEMVQKISQVTVDDIKRVGAEYVQKLFVPGSAHTSIVCHPSKVEELTAAFAEMGFPLKVATTLEESPLA